MGLDGGASMTVVKLCGVSWNACGGARPRKVVGGEGCCFASSVYDIVNVLDL